MLEVAKFAALALGSAAIVGGMLSMVVGFLIKTSQNTSAKRGSEILDALRRHQRPAVPQDRQEKQKGVAFSAV